MLLSSLIKCVLYDKLTNKLKVKIISYKISVFIQLLIIKKKDKIREKYEHDKKY